MNQLIFVAALLLATSVEAFFSAGAKTASAKSPQANEAIETFASKFPFGRPPVSPSPFRSVGMPNRDIDGTVLKKQKKNGSSGKRLTDISESEARATFAELAKLYGEDEALEMTKALPVLLAFNKKNFAACLDAWTGIFGEDESKEMVLRNPGLLAVNPEEAAKATDQTMTVSYVVAATRPIGPVALPSLLALLLVPAAEAVTGIPIRVSFISALTGSDPDTVISTMTQLAKPIWQQF